MNLNRGTGVLVKLVRAGLTAHAIGVLTIDELPDEYTAIVESAARIWEDGDELAFTAMVYALMFQVSMDDSEAETTD